MYHVYVLKSTKNGRYYTGHTDNIPRRVAEHNSGRSRATKYSRPFELVYQESYNTRAEASKRELFLKTGKGREEFKKLIA